MPIAFKDIRDTTNPHNISIGSTLQRIKDGKSSKLIAQIRELSSKMKEVEQKSDEWKELRKEKTKLKGQLPSILFAADAVIEIEKSRKNGDIYKTQRDDACVVKHSGFAPFDADELDNPEEYRDALKENPYVCSAWISPSGDGVNFAVRFQPDIGLHSDLYESFAVRFQPDIGLHSDLYESFVKEYPELKLDTTSRNLARVKYESSDPDIWINEDAKVWTKLLPIKEKIKKPNNAEPSVKDWGKVNIALKKIADSHDGEKMEVLLKISHLFGGWAANRDIDEHTAINLLRTEIQKKDIDDEYVAFKAIDDSFAHGKSAPLSMYKERDVLEMKVGSDKMYYSLSERREELDSFYENGYGKGAKLGWKCSHEYISFVEGGTTFIYGSPAAGKSILSIDFFIWFAQEYNWKFALMTPEEGSVGEIFGTIISSFIGKPIFGKDKMSKEELKRGVEFAEHFFYIIEPKSASITINGFYNQVEGIERQYDVSIKGTFIDPATYLKHEMTGQFNREDLALNESLKTNLVSAKQSDRHHFISIHLRDMARLTDSNGQTYFPMGTPRDLASGQAWYRNGFNMISLWRPIDVKHKPLLDEDGIPYEDNQVQVWIQKFKPRGSGKLGHFNLYFDWKRNQFYEMEHGKKIYPRDSEEEELPDSIASALQPNTDFSNKEPIIEEDDNDIAPF